MKELPFKNKNILVFGLGILGGGEGVVKTLVELGAHVRVTDLQTEEQLADTLKHLPLGKIDSLTLGKHDEADIEWAEIIIKNPGVPTSSLYIQKAISLNKHVTTEAALYLKHAEAFTIGVTGTRGKTTTTMMIYELLKQNLDNNVLVGGNIQNKGSLPLLLQETSETLSVIELSSWALEGCHLEKVSPHIAVITNLFPDHLNRYPDMEAYAYDKAGIFMYQDSDDHVFLNTEHDWFEYFRNRVESHLHLFDQHSLPESIALQLSGNHNRQNAAAAFSVGKLLGIHIDQLKNTLENFTGVAYRQQIVGENDGRTFINDSTSTTPKALEVALETFPDATFIIGGTSKQLPLNELVEKMMDHKGKFVFLKGTGTKELLEAINNVETQSIASLQSSTTFDNLPNAFDQALALTKSGTIVFSPGFTSFELFKNEFDRAEQFDKLVQNHMEQN